MGYYNNHQLQNLVNDLLKAIITHTPETIKASGDEVRAQMQLTQEQEEKVKNALATISRAAEISAKTQEDRTKLEKDKAEHALAASAIEQRWERAGQAERANAVKARDLETRAAAVANAEKKIADAQAQLAVRQKQLDSHAKELNTREAAVIAKETKFRLALAEE
jgi:hypothetical protein